MNLQFEDSFLSYTKSRMLGDSIRCEPPRQWNYMVKTSTPNGADVPTAFQGFDSDTPMRPKEL